MRTNWRSLDTEALLIEAVKNCKSYRSVLIWLGLNPEGGGTNTVLRKHIARLKLDTSHFTGGRWNKNVYKNSGYKSKSNFRKYLIRTRGHRCEECKRKTWKGKLIPLEVEHIDGNKKNNSEENVKLLCCNCHAQTPTWRRAKK